MALQIDDIPFRLRAGDIVKHVVNIDSRFRENPELSTSSKFYFRLLTPIRNVLRIRITSIEFPNNYYIFSTNRRNVTIQLLLDPDGNGVFQSHVTVPIPDGNYSASDLANTINSFFSKHILLTGLSVTFSGITGKYTFTGDIPFGLDTLCTDNVPVPKVPYVFDRPFDYGLGYNMGFSKKTDFAATGPDASGNYSLVSDHFSYFAGDAYVFLKVNNFDCIRQTVYGNDFTALAKVIMYDPKDYMTYNDYANQNPKEVTFPNPYDLTRFEVQVLDPYGNLVEMDTSQFAFSMEVLEVRNLKLYNTIRDAFAADWIV